MSVEKEGQIEESLESLKRISHKFLKAILPFLLVKIEKPKADGSNIYRILKHLGFFD